ncbi:MAG TPA: ATP-dependent DNA helicase RecG [Bdellovibrionales bacterium]|nr:ATP-dependent DNA helicase RecG [Bdellovibrionales bacterium]
MIKLETPVQFIKGVGPKLGDVLRKKGVVTVQDLLEWYPRAYEDRRAARNIASLKPDELVSLRAQIVRVSSFNMGKSKRKIYDVTLTDSTGKIHCKFFRVPYKGYFERFKAGEWVRVIGKVTLYRGQIEFHHPDMQDDAAEEGSDSNKVIPVYPESEGMTNRQIRKLVELSIDELKKSLAEPALAAAKSHSAQPKLGASALGRRLPTSVRKSNNVAMSEPPPANQIEKFPEWLRGKYKLVERFEALEKIHLPPPDAGADFVDQTSPYHRRIIFEEFFWLELYLASKKSGLKREAAPAFEKKMSLVEKLKKSLPFEMTNAQLRSLNEIVGDLVKPHPMHRLVQGDVGSGKTLVALASALIAHENEFQSAIMVPTEILAEQHYQNAKKFLEPLGITVGLLTGSMKTAERNQTYDMLKNGLIHLVVGTHALIQEAVEFKQLGLVVIDEQHRFGVHQRSMLKRKGLSPHFLVMTATPIPRTLAMTVYGDLDVSIIDELPKGRAPITTRVTYESKRPEVMKFLKEQLAKGRQVYVVYPLIEESEKIDLKDAMTAFENLKEELAPKFKVGLLHGKMKADEKDEVMRGFRAKEFDVLVSTTVIEVGVDVPNANLMLIEHAERFGLSQLHQLRGRVGRGEHKSFCVLMLGQAVSDESRERTRIMEQTSDGFKIAEADLAIRGPGEFLGSRQSGLAGFKMANLVRDISILTEARNAAFEILEKDSQLKSPEHRALRDELLRTHGATALASVG